ncbi:MAG: flagellar assembly protein FliW [Candidatus Omnitrophica bacterium]|jgi:flagellar assembly factor FliW|nr:flagellar assembly protein FliW [Candidatus Omnitrophota bacterium]
MANVQPPHTTNIIQFQSDRFGEVEIPIPEILTFPEGLLGFGRFHQYAILQDPGEAPFLWLQSIEKSDLSFVIADPFLFFPGYDIQVKTAELDDIDLRDLSKAVVYAIITIPKNPMNLTANLRGPVVINSEAKLAKQFVLIDDRYHTKHFLLKDIPPYLSHAPNNSKSADSISHIAESGEQDR